MAAERDIAYVRLAVILFNIAVYWPVLSDEGVRWLAALVSVVAVGYSRLGPRQRLEAWVRLLALTRAWPERPVEAVTIGRLRTGGPRGLTVSVARLRLPGDAAERWATAGRHLEALLDLHDRGLREPLPLYAATSAAYAAAVRAGADPEAAAGAAWTSRSYDKEDRDPEHRLVLGGIRSSAELLGEAPREDERGDGPTDEPSRLGRYARRLWDGLLDHEELTDA